MKINITPILIKKKKHTVYIDIQAVEHGKQIRKRISTKLECSLTNWDKKKRTIKNDDLKKEALTLKLNWYRNEYNKLSRKLGYEASITDYITHLNDPKDTPILLVDYIKEVRKKKQISEASKKNYDRLLNHIEDFEKKTKQKYQLHKVNVHVIDAWTDYLLELKHENNQPYSQITLKKFFSSLLSVYNFAFEKGVIETLEHKRWKNPFRELDKDIVSLTKEDIKTLKTTILPVRYEKVKDLFLLGVYTGQRFSDVVTINENNIRDNNIQLRQEKTKQLVKIPFSANIKSIFDKYNNELSQLSVTQQYFNRTIKEVFQQAKLERIIETTEIRGKNKAFTVQQPLHEYASSHMARRTFITLALEAGASPKDVMRLSGHTDFKSFQKYANSTTESLQTASELINNKAFAV